PSRGWPQDRGSCPKTARHGSSRQRSSACTAPSPRSRAGERRPCVIGCTRRMTRWGRSLHNGFSRRKDSSMSSSTWTPPAVASESKACELTLWRAVEAQHVVATRALVDSIAEQEILESVLEASKPPLPSPCTGLDYLLYTPFRYPPSWRGSRFRNYDDAGVWYGAEAVRTSCAELGYW